MVQKCRVLLRVTTMTASCFCCETQQKCRDGSDDKGVDCRRLPICVKGHLCVCVVCSIRILCVCVFVYLCRPEQSLGERWRQ